MMNISTITRLANVLALLSIFSQCLAVNVRDFGAVGDGRHIDSPAINAALEHVAGEGGGVVTLSEGIYLSYSIHLQSNVTLQLERGAVLKSAPVTETEGYDAPEANDSPYQDFGH
ncbi:MAG: glycoside hydrolase family 28 protein, partial [Bacteroidales bacterium]|nr:glycoside hydrolase family 28 protein [Bacteroidales bacterium]